MSEKPTNPPPCENRPYKLEAVIVCENYADFLAYTLLENKIFFDNLVVVTSPEDKRTRRLCYHLESEKLQHGANWNGRATKLFGG